MKPLKLKDGGKVEVPPLSAVPFAGFMWISMGP